MMFSDHFWTPAFLTGSLITLALFMLLPNLRFEQDVIDEPVIEIDFMQWREPEPLTKPEQKPQPVKPRLLPKPRQVESKPKLTSPASEPVHRQERVIDPGPQEKPEPETVPTQQSAAPIPEKVLAPASAEQEIKTETLPDPVPLFKLTSLPRFVHKMQPEYPPEMRALGKESLVKLEVLIDRLGKVRKITVLQSGGEAFDRAAMKALESSTFIPGNIDGQPVAVRMRIPIKFTLR